MKKKIGRFLYMSSRTHLAIFFLLFLSLIALIAVGLFRGEPGFFIAALAVGICFGAYVLLVYTLPFCQILSYERASANGANPPDVRKYLFVDYLFDRLRTEAEEVASRRSMEQLNEIANIKLLQSQISPHFLYNTLDSVRGELYLRKMYDIADMVEALSCLFRFNIDQNKMLIPLAEELDNTEKYVRIMQFRFANKFLLLKQFDESDETIMNYPIPKLTLQPIVENAIQHGLETKIGSGVIVLRIQYTDKTMLITVEDDGSGMDSETLDRLNAQLLKPFDSPPHSGRGSGIALRNINERVCLLYGPEYGLSVASCSARGTQVTLMIPRNPVNPFEQKG